VFSLWFTESYVSSIELNLELKYQANDIKISQIFIYGVISPPAENYEFSIDSGVVCLWFTQSCVSVAELNQPLNFI